MNLIQTTIISLAISPHLGTLILLSARKSRLQRDSSLPSEVRPSLAIIRFYGTLSAICTLSAPYAFANDPVLQPALRCICFFYACKILDLSLAQAKSPPTLMLGGDVEDYERSPAQLVSLSDHSIYAFKLLTEMRFFSFDVAAKQKDRPLSGKDPLSPAWNWMAPFAIIASAYLIPIPQLKCLAVLLVIQLGLESLHTVVHFNRKSCNQPLFYKPFAAISFSSFWSTHWHAAAAPFLQSLAYQPGKRYVGRWFGVLAAFNLTGIWHAWASAPLVDSSHALELAFKVWAMFMVMGIGVLAERVIWGKNQGGLVQRAGVWSVSVFSAGWAYRTLECHSRIPFLRSETCNI